MRTLAIAAAMLLAIPALALAQTDTTTAPATPMAPMSQPADGATSTAMPMHHATRHHRKRHRHHKHSMTTPAAAPTSPAT